MVINTNKHTRKTPAKQGDERVPRKPIRIGAATPYDFKGSHLTPYGGLLPAATMLENLGFQELVERHVTIKRMTTSMPGFRFVMAMILALYVGWSRLNHFQFLQQEPMLTGILGVEQLPVQSTFWRFLESLHLVVARQLLGHAAHAAAGLGGGTCGIERGHAGHRHDCADGVRAAQDGSA